MLYLACPMQPIDCDLIARAVRSAFVLPGEMRFWRGCGGSTSQGTIESTIAISCRFAFPAAASDKLQLGRNKQKMFGEFLVKVGILKSRILPIQVLVQFLDKYMMYKYRIHLASALPALCRQYLAGFPASVARLN